MRGLDDRPSAARSWQSSVAGLCLSHGCHIMHQGCRALSVVHGGASAERMFHSYCGPSPRRSIYTVCTRAPSLHLRVRVPQSIARIVCFPTSRVKFQVEGSVIMLSVLLSRSGMAVRGLVYRFSTRGCALHCYLPSSSTSRTSDFHPSLSQELERAGDVAGC
jgi:hypothetical protein